MGMLHRNPREKARRGLRAYSRCSLTGPPAPPGFFPRVSVTFLLVFCERRPVITFGPFPHRNPWKYKFPHKNPWHHKFPHKNLSTSCNLSWLQFLPKKPWDKTPSPHRKRRGKGPLAAFCLPSPFTMRRCAFPHGFCGVRNPAFASLMVTHEGRWTWGITWLR